MELKQVINVTAILVLWSINRTFMELKLASLPEDLPRLLVLIEPLWN